MVIQREEIERQVALPGTPEQPYECSSLKMVPLPRSARTFIIAIISLTTTLALCLIFVPWQQSISGRGRVIIFSPMERPQNVEAQIPGRIQRWYVRDGQVVKKGEILVTLSEIDPEFLDPRLLDRLTNQRKAQVERRDAASARIGALGTQLDDLIASQNAAVPAAFQRFQQARDRLRAAEQALKAEQQNLRTAELNLERRQALYDKGLRSKRDLELAELDQVTAATQVERARANVNVSEKELAATQYEYRKVMADTSAAINNVKAAIASARETVATTDAEIQKLDVQIAAINRRIEQRTLRAPIDGRVVRLSQVGTSETVKAGQWLALIAPQTEDLAAELIVSGNDAPLVSPGEVARLQFAGWPAIQFTGWPSVAVGTFAGKVAVVDQVDDGTGRYRVIVVPDQQAVIEKRDEPWPSSRFLRPGSEVTGWIMLKVVPLGFELWRQFNAFPPTIDRPEHGGGKMPEQAEDVKVLKRKGK